MLLHTVPVKSHFFHSIPFNSRPPNVPYAPYMLIERSKKKGYRERCPHPPEAAKAEACAHGRSSRVYQRVVVIPSMVAEADGWQISLIAPMEDVNGL